MQIYQVDAFAARLFQGNPAAVVPLTEWLSDEVMQCIAMENNLAETAFFVPEGNGFAIRWFTPTVEVDLCGHATLATGHVLFEHLGYEGDAILFHTLRAGDLQVLRGDVPGRYTLNFPETPAEHVDEGPLGILFEGLQIPARPVMKGPYDYLIVLDHQREVEALRPDFNRLSGAPGRGIIVTAPGDGVDFVSRGFFPQSGIDEDPVTGSAHAMLAPYWATRLGKKRMSAVQLSARRGQVDCVIDRGRVYMTGTAHTFLCGELCL
jgi:PhzF family phenazine biosynthesis protein